MGIKLMEGDCMKLMKSIDNNSIDLILCDLPYETTDRYGSKKGKSRIFKWDSIIPLEALWVEYKRIIKKNGAVVLTADQPFTSQLICSNIEWFKYEWIWKKNRTTGFLTANYRPMKQSEDVVVFSEGGASAASKNKMKYNPQGLIEKRVKKKNNPKRLGKVLGNEDFLGKGNKLLTELEYEQKFTNYPSEILEVAVEKDTLHPTQKPIALMKYLIKTYSDEGDLVLDNCMGVGTTGIACIRTNRNFIGIELNEEFFKIANKKIKLESSKKSFFE
jgi:site-specific DNA-methyltransferase (adenine-specific)